MRRRALSIALVAGVTGVFVVGTSSTASAHEERTVGRFVLAVGFGSEPAYAGQENSVQMFLHERNTDKAVTDLGPTLKVEVRYGSKTMPAMVMEPDFEVGEFGTPGDYRAFFFPTRPGDYSFHFTGTITGQDVDETFASGKSTFSPVTDPTDVEFPAKDPTTGELGQAVKRLVPRVDFLINKLSKANADVASLKDDVDSAKSLATIALAVGAVAGLAGLIVGVAALMAARRGRATAAG